ncbi:MAG: hypothetical protein COV74_05275 [Candidatus Omnitrophica bacterium CG11_big_fil_rev_8_21_14_0_20_45_26]|uniref:Uncharacterized protein n=1 Tax=Candidatus Abzuiibacterium crystallinum TaxID=1974748 RepID=A0A2H0LPH2_9BACT|nr:MAG: hypothetical protein COV74_05275 [Candidatus Omnitrophica bacterium CG11_big_fil_rev_8_21_14_0_20_45_26]PIW64302.1 MAG: hypothetical protein COW12_06595 [Candidatus Omnitrophica bacterium CG12_big_fil_rev_8_21_14_0_65_45_16]
MQKIKTILTQLIALVIVISLYLGVVYLPVCFLLKELKTKPEIQISGWWVPTSFLPGKYRVISPKISWKEKFNLLSGEVQIALDQKKLFTTNQLITLSAKDITVQLDQDLSSFSPKHQFEIEHVKAVLEMVNFEDPVIHSIEIQSPELQFRFAPR